MISVRFRPVELATASRMLTSSAGTSSRISTVGTIASGGVESLGRGEGWHPVGVGIEVWTQVMRRDLSIQCLHDCQNLLRRHRAPTEP